MTFAGGRPVLDWRRHDPDRSLSPAGLHRRDPDPPDPAPLGEGRGDVGRLRRGRRRGCHGRLADGAQPGPLDHPVRGRVRGEHDRAAEGLAPPRAQVTVTATVYLPLPTARSFEPVSLNVAEASCPESTCVTSSVTWLPTPIASAEPNSSLRVNSRTCDSPSLSLTVSVL